MRAQQDIFEKRVKNSKKIFNLYTLKKQINEYDESVFNFEHVFKSITYDLQFI
jgi:hypothetical protein